MSGEDTKPKLEEDGEQEAAVAPEAAGTATEAVKPEVAPVMQDANPAANPVLVVEATASEAAEKGKEPTHVAAPPACVGGVEQPAPPAAVPLVVQPAAAAAAGAAAAPVPAAMAMPSLPAAQPATWGAAAGGPPSGVPAAAEAAAVEGGAPEETFYVPPPRPPPKPKPVLKPVLPAKPHGPEFGATWTPLEVAVKKRRRSTSVYKPTRHLDILFSCSDGDMPAFLRHRGSALVHKEVRERRAPAAGRPQQQQQQQARRPAARDQDEDYEDEEGGNKAHHYSTRRRNATRSYKDLYPDLMADDDDEGDEDENIEKVRHMGGGRALRR
jgi:hypothetical protein